MFTQLLVSFEVFLPTIFILDRNTDRIFSQLPNVRAILKKKKKKKKQEIKFYLGKNTVTTRKFVLAPYENSLSGIHLNFRPRLCKKALTVPQISHNYISRRVFDAWDSSFALYAPLFLFNALGFILFLAVTRILKRDSRDSRPFHRRELDVLNGIFW